MNVKVIKSEKEYNQALERLDVVFDTPPDTPEGDEAELSLKIPIVAISKNKVGIARNISGHWRLIGWGEIIG